VAGLTTCCYDWLSVLPLVPLLFILHLNVRARGVHPDGEMTFRALLDLPFSCCAACLLRVFVLLVLEDDIHCDCILPLHDPTDAITLGDDDGLYRAFVLFYAFCSWVVLRDGTTVVFCSTATSTRRCARYLFYFICPSGYSCSDHIPLVLPLALPLACLLPLEA
jgi:hypothetical protein